MPKSLLALLLPLALLPAAQGSGERTAPPPTDEERALATVLRYLDAFYETRPELLDECLAPEWIRRGFHIPAPGAGFHPTTMDRAKARDAAAALRASTWIAAKDAPREARLLDLHDRIAAVRLHAFWGIEYHHLEKDEAGTWHIVQTVWQAIPGRRDSR
jgi:hypothetical protein